MPKNKTKSVKMAKKNQHKCIQIINAFNHGCDEVSLDYFYSQTTYYYYVKLKPFEIMSQKVQIYKVTSVKQPAYGKYFVRAVYGDKFITTEELADFIQQQATVKRSDCKAVLDELGAAMKYFFEMGQKIRLDGIGIFKVGLSSKGSTELSGCTASNVCKCRVLFSPETLSIPSGETATVTRATMVDGTPTAVTRQVRIYNHPVTMLKDVCFELAENSLGHGTGVVVNPGA